MKYTGVRVSVMVRSFCSVVVGHGAPDDDDDARQSLTACTDHCWGDVSFCPLRAVKSTVSLFAHVVTDSAAPGLDAREQAASVPGTVCPAAAALRLLLQPCNSSSRSALDPRRRLMTAGGGPAPRGIVALRAR